MQLSNDLISYRWIRSAARTLLGGWMRFLLAWAGDKNRLFFDPVYSLKLGEWSGRLNGFVTSDRKFCFEKLSPEKVGEREQYNWINQTVSIDDVAAENAYAICNLPMFPIGILFKCCTQRSTATPSPIWTIAVPSFVFKNFIFTKRRREKEGTQDNHINSGQPSSQSHRSLTLATFPYRQTKLNNLSVFDVSPSSP